MTDHNEALRAAATFRQSIRPAKAAADKMLSHLGVLLADTAGIAERHAGPLSDGQEAITVIGEVIVDTIGVRRGLIRAHLAARAAGEKLLPELAWGDAENTEPKSFVEDRPLRIVGRQD